MIDACAYRLKDIQSRALGIARRYIARGERDPGYQIDLCLQGLLCLHDSTGLAPLREHVDAVLRHRGHRPEDSLNWRILFTDLHAELWMRTRDDVYLQGWLDDLKDLKEHLPRDDDGQIVFFIEPDRQRLLIDLLQGYAIRMARAGLFTGDDDFLRDAVDQYARHARILVNPANGLWHHGRGWNPANPRALSPEGWCRGQAWVVRGLVETMVCLPETSREFGELQGLLNNLTDALRTHQDDDGMWHHVVHMPSASFPESSGTAMLVYHLGRAWQRGWLREPGIRTALVRAQYALLHYVDDAFRVHHGCPHTPPHASVADYLAMTPATDDPHAIGGMMMALSLSLDEDAGNDTPYRGHSTEMR